MSPSFPITMPMLQGKFKIGLKNYHQIIDIILNQPF